MTTIRKISKQEKKFMLSDLVKACLVRGIDYQDLLDSPCVPAKVLILLMRDGFGVDKTRIDQVLGAERNISEDEIELPIPTRIIERMAKVRERRDFNPTHEVLLRSEELTLLLANKRGRALMVAELLINGSKYFKRCSKEKILQIYRDYIKIDDEINVIYPWLGEFFKFARQPEVVMNRHEKKHWSGIHNPHFKKYCDELGINFDLMRISNNIGVITLILLTKDGGLVSPQSIFTMAANSPIQAGIYKRIFILEDDLNWVSRPIADDDKMGRFARSGQLIRGTVSKSVLDELTKYD
jgi:hypothetical protein